MKTLKELEEIINKCNSGHTIKIQISLFDDDFLITKEMRFIQIQNISSIEVIKNAN